MGAFFTPAFDVPVLAGATPSTVSTPVFLALVRAEAAPSTVFTRAFKAPVLAETSPSTVLSWAKAGKDNTESREGTRSEGDDLEESAPRALMRHGGKGRGVRAEG